MTVGDALNGRIFKYVSAHAESIERNPTASR